MQSMRDSINAYQPVMGIVSVSSPTILALSQETRPWPDQRGARSSCNER